MGFPKYRGGRHCLMGWRRTVDATGAIDVNHMHRHGAFATTRVIPWTWSRGMERLKSIDGLRGLRFHVPFELPQHHLVWREIDKRKSVLFDRLDLFLHVEMHGRQ